jgi:hypothetical protein
MPGYVEQLPASKFFFLIFGWACETEFEPKNEPERP